MLIAQSFSEIKANKVKLSFEVFLFICTLWSLFEPEIILIYIKFFRCLRVLLIIRETYLIVPFHNLLASLRSVGNILTPALLFIYAYSVVGLYTFSGKKFIILDN